jgi:hypothetical protein
MLFRFFARLAPDKMSEHLHQIILALLSTLPAKAEILLQVPLVGVQQVVQFFP